MFQLHSKFKPTGHQPQAIKKLVQNIKAGAKDNVLLGVTGSGKTAVLGWVIEELQLPTLFINHNKTLCAQNYQEFKEFFPNNAVHFFVSYYDYYQPEAYLPTTDTYIEKDAKINQQIDQLRHAAVQDLLLRKDVIIVASVSCIYNLGSPEDYQKVSLKLSQGQPIKRQELLKNLVALQYQRNDFDFKPGSFRARGGVVEINLVTGEEILRIELFNDRIEAISKGKNTLVSCSMFHIPCCRLFPANFWTAPEDKLKLALANIRTELAEQLKSLKAQNKLLEAQRLEQRANYDLEMIEHTGV